ncbi:MAG: flavin reductase family protein [Hyphomicrobiaceae bacterium]
MDSDSYRQIMRHQAGAVAIIAVGDAGGRTGLTATAVCSLSDSPPMLLACVNRAASAHDPISEIGSFSVNLLAADQQDVAACFSGQTGLKGEARFTEAGWTTLATGAPILSSALASLDCRLVDRHAFATHTVFIGAVEGGRVRAEAAPLLYFRGDYWDLGRG